MEEGETKRGSTGSLLSCVGVFASITAAVLLIYRAGWSLGYILIPALWGLGAILPLRAGEGGLLTFGVKGQLLRTGLRYFILSSLLLFPFYGLGYYLYARWGFPIPRGNPFEAISLFRWLLHNYLAVALFEELFFRGFVQGRFENFARAGSAGAASIFWIPVLVSSFLFALAHVAVYLDPLRFVVFFPGLLFAWLRARTGSLLAPILSHGTANLVSVLLMAWVS